MKYCETSLLNKQKDETNNKKIFFSDLVSERRSVIDEHIVQGWTSNK